MSLSDFRLDFAGGILESPLWHTVAFIAGLLAAVGGALAYADARSTLDFMSDSQANALLKAQSARPVEISVEQSRALREQVNAVNQYIRLLNVPWDDVFRAIRPPPDVKVAILGLDMAGRADSLRISAEADRPEEMTDYVAYLTDKRQLIDIYLVRHELTRDGNFRFDVEAAWRNR